ncbi:hypothetical protein BaRGS_00011152, partial [Batillaria attramentaria]
SSLNALSYRGQNRLEKASIMSETMHHASGAAHGFTSSEGGLKSVAKLQEEERDFLSEPYRFFCLYPGAAQRAPVTSDKRCTVRQVAKSEIGERCKYFIVLLHAKHVFFVMRPFPRCMRRRESMLTMFVRNGRIQ